MNSEATTAYRNQYDRHTPWNEFPRWFSPTKNSQTGGLLGEYLPRPFNTIASSSLSVCKSRTSVRKLFRGASSVSGWPTLLFRFDDSPWPPHGTQCPRALFGRPTCDPRPTTQMNPPRTVHGHPARTPHGHPRVVHRNPSDAPRTPQRRPSDAQRTSHGLSMHNPRTPDGLFTDYPQTVHAHPTDCRQTASGRRIPHRRPTDTPPAVHVHPTDCSWTAPHGLRMYIPRTLDAHTSRTV